MPDKSMGMQDLASKLHFRNPTAFIGDADMLCAFPRFEGSFGATAGYPAIPRNHTASARLEASVQL
jgi:hypothetical protein